MVKNSATMASANLLATDPPRIGDFWLTNRILANESGVAFLANDEHGQQVMVLLLSNGASSDGAARDRFFGEIDLLHVDTVVARSTDFSPVNQSALPKRGLVEQTAELVLDTTTDMAGWAALRFGDLDAAVVEAARIFSAVDLAQTSSIGAPSGPDYRLPWSADATLGSWRAWPPLPVRKDQAGRPTILVALFGVIMLAMLGLLIAVLIFQQPDPPPIPEKQNQQTSHTQGEAGSPTSGSPSSPSSGSSSPNEPQDSPSSPKLSPLNPDSSSSDGSSGSSNRRLDLRP